MPQTPQTPLEGILADADLDVCGRADFLALNRSCVPSWRRPAARPAITNGTVSSPTFYGRTATEPQPRAVRDEMKRANIAALEQLLLATEKMG
jgi:hypothetical protein